MIYGSEVWFVLSKQNRCAFVCSSIYIPGLVTWQPYSFTLFSIKPPLNASYFCVSLDDGCVLLWTRALQFHLYPVSVTINSNNPLFHWCYALETVVISFTDKGWKMSKACRHQACASEQLKLHFPTGVIWFMCHLDLSISPTHSRRSLHPCWSTFKLQTIKSPNFSRRLFFTEDYLCRELLHLRKTMTWGSIFTKPVSIWWSTAVFIVG